MTTADTASYTFEAVRSKETKNKVVYSEVEPKKGDTAVDSLYIAKWLVQELSKDTGECDRIKVTVEVLHG
jgi:hypothetical protein